MPSFSKLLIVHDFFLAALYAKCASSKFTGLDARVLYPSGCATETLDSKFKKIDRARLLTGPILAGSDKSI